MAGVGHTLPVSRSALIGRRLSAATYGLCLERQNPDIAIARPQGRSRPSIAREDGRRRPLGRAMDARERAYGSSGLRLLPRPRDAWNLAGRVDVPA